MALKYVDEIELKGKRVLARFDFNVPFEEKNGQRVIADTTRVDMALPTINYILNQGASKLVLMSHLGRPKGQYEEKYDLEPVAAYLAEKLGQEVILTESAVDPGIKDLLNLRGTKVVLLQNIRFHKEEEKNDRDFARKLSTLGDIYVNDAFGAAHRKHASTYEINAFFKDKAVGGFLLKKEIEALKKVTENPKRPFMAVVGGAKISDKIKTLERLLVSVDKLFIGGAMAYPFLKAQGKSVGNSRCSDEDVQLAKRILSQDKGHKLTFPVDHIISEGLDGKPETINTADIPEGKMGLDIGPKTIELYKEGLRKAETIFWNGPMGLFENPAFSKGTLEVARALADSRAFTFVGGGDSVNAVNDFKLADKISHISTGGGASLEYIESGDLPGIQALKFGLE